jgi:hypothetical protein
MTSQPTPPGDGRVDEPRPQIPLDSAHPGPFPSSSWDAGVPGARRPRDDQPPHEHGAAAAPETT